MWISLESEDGSSFGEGNANWDEDPVTYDENITLKVPEGKYYLMVFPMNHSAGYASNGDDANDDELTEFNTLNWSEEDKVNITEDSTITITLPSAENLGAVKGVVECGESDCSGWIDAKRINTQFAKGEYVESNGSFEIKGLEAGDYELTYFAYNSKTLLSATTTITGGGVSEVTLQKDESNVYSKISGSVSGNSENDYVGLFKTNGTDYELIQTADINGNSYEFNDIAKPTSGYTYFVGVVSETIDSNTGASTTTIKATQKVDSASSINIPSSISTDSNYNINVTAE